MKTFIQTKRKCCAFRYVIVYTSRQTAAVESSPTCLHNNLSYIEEKIVVDNNTGVQHGTSDGYCRRLLCKEDYVYVDCEVDE